MSMVCLELSLICLILMVFYHTMKSELTSTYKTNSLNITIQLAILISTKHSLVL